MKIKLENDKIIDLEYKNFKKMMLIFNAIEDGWNVIKNEDKYYFTKNHENKKEYLTDDYVSEFLKKYLIN
tara:strand:- start:204 stop:413 length:210 start_codon:yes stop_codon:yes gene_type:complete